ncbi:Clavaminate synthase-like protein [Hypoxylon trugodes]|uniref:Clavaminate synthase-like protein n=1 Tax=Hypoxylon trugodes TaxID=326681 RepID=UPI00219CFCE8|nr:Clavaminate synthase-like protein [Hypoxylon trugodes]KAI1393085.1 Clavaminate synthase-like protein [Hypoxylon trugodes]
MSRYAGSVTTMLVPHPQNLDKVEHQLEPFTCGEPTREPLAWASLRELDLSKFDDGIESRKLLAAELVKSLHTTGFLYIKNHGLQSTVIQHHLNIANTLLKIPYEEKLAYEIVQDKASNKRYHGFAPQSYRKKTIYEDNVEHYNISRFVSEVGDEQESSFPPVLHPYLSDIKYLSEYVHKVIARKILILIAIALEVDEMTFTNIHTYEAKNDSFLRYMQYLPRSSRDNEESKDLYLPGHADWGSLTFLFNQPTSGLQILDQQGDWKWVKYVPDTIVVNVGIALGAMTGDYLKPTIHRVIKPPEDQAQRPRLSLIYFLRPYDTHSLSMISSPILKRLGRKPTIDLTMGEYTRLGKTGVFRVNYDSDKAGAQTRMFNQIKQQASQEGEGVDTDARDFKSI